MHSHPHRWAEGPGELKIPHLGGSLWPLGKPGTLEGRDRTLLVSEPMEPSHGKTDPLYVARLANLVPGGSFPGLARGWAQNNLPTPAGASGTIHAGLGNGIKGLAWW